LNRKFGFGGNDDDVECQPEAISLTCTFIPINFKLRRGNQGDLINTSYQSRLEVISADVSRSVTKALEEVRYLKR